ncbi:MAG: hypothetical protein R3284_05045 [Rubricoccaceae bacterium]|nr:hypothetical protein [Rubricoccaceae bacterium]
MKKDDLTGIGASLGIHLLALLFAGALVLGSKNPEPQIRLLHIEIGSLASEARPSAPSERPDPRQPHQRPDPQPPRTQTPTQTSVQPPRTESPSRSEQTITRPNRNEQAQPDPPSPAVRDNQTDGGGGNPDGERGQDNNPDDAAGLGNEGTSGVAIEGLGNRRATCPRPRHPGVNGTVVYVVTFGPDGRYVSSRPSTRGGDRRLDQAVQSVLSACRAEALSASASQVNQPGTVTFRFRN